MRFTDRTIAAIPSPEHGQRLYTEDTIPGFGLRVGATAKAFVLTMREERRRITIGRYPIVSLAQAREKAKSLLAKRQLGPDHHPTPFFGEEREQFHSSRRARIAMSTAQRDERVLKRFFSLDHKRVGSITPDDVQAIIDGSWRPCSASQTLSAISSARARSGTGQSNSWRAVEFRYTAIASRRALQGNVSVRSDFRLPTSEHQGFLPPLSRL